MPKVQLEALTRLAARALERAGARKCEAAVIGERLQIPGRYAGDDATDLDAFAALDGLELGVRNRRVAARAGAAAVKEACHGPGT